MMEHYTQVAKRGTTPYIGLRGKWLKDAGFAYGMPVKVDIENGQLTITPNMEMEDSLEGLIRKEHKPSRFSNDYRGYTVRLLLEQDTEYKPLKLESPEDVYHFLRPLQYESREVSLSIALDPDQNVVSVYDVGKGGVGGVQFSPVEVVKSTLLVNSTDIILAHNHPSGNPKPSLNDLNMTGRMLHVAELVGIRVLDHVIIGFNDYASLQELGFIEQWKYGNRSKTSAKELMQ